MSLRMKNMGTASLALAFLFLVLALIGCNLITPKSKRYMYLYMRQRLQPLDKIKSDPKIIQDAQWNPAPSPDHCLGVWHQIRYL